MSAGRKKRLQSIAVAFFLPFIFLSCGGGGSGTGGGDESHPPIISNIRLSTGIAPHDNTPISAYIDFHDSGEDIAEVHLTVRDADNVVVGGDSITVHGADGLMSGTITVLLYPSAFPLGAWKFDISLIDARGTSSNSLSETVRIVPGFGPTTFYSNPIPYLFLGGIVVGDLNADGMNDVAMIQVGVDVVHFPVMGIAAVYYQNATGIFDGSALIQSSLTGAVGGIAIGDVTGDRRPDFVMSGTPWPSDPFSAFNGRLVVYAQQPDGTLGEPAEYPVALNFPFDLYGIGGNAIADIDGDGRNDVVVLSDGSIQILYGNASGALDTGVTILQRTTSFRAWGGIQAVDLDTDGRLEIVVQGWPTSIAVVRQTVPRSFAPPEIYEIPIAGVRGPQIRSFAIEDLNGDGRRDILTIDNGNNFTFLLQTLPGTFVLQPSFNISGILPTRAAIADIDGDGLNDLLVGSGNAVWILYQSTAHTYDERLAYGFPTLGGPGGSWGLGDVTGDGKPDLLLTWSTDGLYVQKQH